MPVVWHITDNPKWELDPEYHPTWAYQYSGGPMEKPGLFVSEHPIYWQPYFGIGPLWAVRLQVPEDAFGDLPGYHPERLVTDFSDVEVLEIIPLSEAIERGEEEDEAERRREISWADQQYEGFGHVDDWWFVYEKVHDDRGFELDPKSIPRRGLTQLKRKWKAAHPGFKNPDEYYNRKT